VRQFCSDGSLDVPQGGYQRLLVMDGELVTDGEQGLCKILPGEVLFDEFTFGENADVQLIGQLSELD
jgi:hypothetical protein